jgi:hypothetical protein
MPPASSPPTLRLVPEAADLPEPVANGSWRLWRSLVWSEWFLHSRLLLCFLLGWLAVVWLLPLVAHPLWVLGVGFVFALVAGPAFGGADVIHGCEEFSFAFPPTRTQRFTARFVVGASWLLALTVMDVLALDQNFSDVLFRVFLDTGLATVEVRQPEMLYGLVLAAPFAVFALGFAVAALATNRTVAFTAWLWAALGALSTLRLGFYAEEAIWNRLNGRLSVPAILGVALAATLIARRLYRHKEAGTGVPLRIPLSWWATLLLALLAGLGVAALIGWVAANFARFL